MRPRVKTTLLVAMSVRSRKSAETDIVTAAEMAAETEDERVAETGAISVRVAVRAAEMDAISVRVDVTGVNRATDFATINVRSNPRAMPQAAAVTVGRTSRSVRAPNSPCGRVRRNSVRS